MTIISVTFLNLLSVAYFPISENLLDAVERYLKKHKQIYVMISYILFFVLLLLIT